MKKKLKTVRLDKLPEGMKEELGIPADMDDFRDIVKNSPEIQAKLAVLENAPEFVGESKQVPTAGVWRTTLSQETIKQRNEFIIGMFLLWVSRSSIYNNTNNKASVGWRYPLKMEVIKKIVTKHFSRPSKTMLEEQKENLALKDAQFEVMQWVIERASKWARAKKDEQRKPFEFITTREKIFQMHQLMVENRNWNMSRMNPAISINNNTLNMHVEGDMHVSSFQRGSTMMHLKQSEGYKKLMGKLNAKLWIDVDEADDEDDDIIEGEVLDADDDNG
jgi:hypothetical protein